MPYLTIIVPSGTAIGKTVDAKIGAAPARVTLLNERTVRLEPDGVVCTVLSSITQDGSSTLCVIGGRRRA